MSERNNDKSNIDIYRRINNNIDPNQIDHDRYIWGCACEMCTKPGLRTIEIQHPSYNIYYNPPKNLKVKRKDTKRPFKAIPDAKKKFQPTDNFFKKNLNLTNDPIKTVPIKNINWGKKVQKTVEPINKTKTIVNPKMNASVLKSELKSEPIKSKQLKSEPIKSKQLKSEPIKSKQLKSEPIKSKQLKSEPIKSKQLKSEPIKSKQLKSEPKVLPFESKPIVKPKSNLPLVIPTSVKQPVPIQPVLIQTVSAPIPVTTTGSELAYVPNRKKPFFIGATIFLILVIAASLTSAIVISKKESIPPTPTPIPVDKFDMSNFYSDNTLVDEIGVKTWDVDKQSGEVYYPLDWDEDNGSMINDDDLNWMFDETDANNHVLQTIIDNIQDSDANENGDFDNLTINDFELDWSYGYSEGIYTETIKPSDTDNAKTLLAGDYTFSIYNYPPINLSTLGDNGTSTLNWDNGWNGNTIFMPGQIPTTNDNVVNIDASRRLTDTVSLYFEDDNFFEDDQYNKLAMYGDYFENDKDPKDNYFTTQYTMNPKSFYNIDEGTDDLIRVPLSPNGDDLKKNWKGDVQNKTFSIAINPGSAVVNDPTVIGSLNLVVSWASVE